MTNQIYTNLIGKHDLTIDDINKSIDTIKKQQEEEKKSRKK
jgi:hypothetical protein